MSEISGADSSLKSQSPSVDQLFSIWSARYLSESCKVVSSYALENSASLQGRQQTARRLQKGLIENICKRAAVRTKDLYVQYEYLDLKETAELARLAGRVYGVLLNFYRTHEPISVSSQLDNKSIGQVSLPLFAIPEINTLARLIDPFLSEFQSDDVRSTNWQTRSFLTTELNLSSKLLLKFLTSAEKTLLSPYFTFLEEHAAIPWQRVCLAAADHTLTSPTFKLVERMLPEISDISMTVYTQGCKRFRDYYNRRGRLDDPGVKHSSLRDLDMFQVYLWLCVLQGDMAAIEQELFGLCDLVYRGINVPWDMASQATIMLVTEIMKKLDSSDRNLLDPYAYGLMRAFATGRNNQLHGQAFPLSKHSAKNAIYNSGGNNAVNRTNP